MTDNTLKAAPKALVIGAGGGIGSALVRQLLTIWPERVWALSSQADLAFDGASNFTCRHQQPDIIDWAATHGSKLAEVERIVIATGQLHGPGLEPEKRLEQLQADALMALYHANAVLPLCWLSALAPHLKDTGVIAVLSARVGSIGDNRLGGWYSYRAAKAGLNQGLQCAAIELARRLPGFKLMAYHPGTVDTRLSKPFQRRVPKGQLMDPDDTASRLLHLMDTTEADGQLSYLDWRGQTIPW